MNHLVFSEVEADVELLRRMLVIGYTMLGRKCYVRPAEARVFGPELGIALFANGSATLHPVRCALGRQ